MINYFFSSLDYGSVAFVGILFAFAMTCLMLSKCTRILPKDMGRAYAHDGSLSAGKPRGAGFWFVLVYVVSTLIFAKMNVEILIYLILVVAAMLTGFLDDCAKSPWGEYKKGILDLIIAIMLAITFLNFNDNRIFIACADKYVTINPVVFGILIVILVWASINVTNCSDGVDGLSGTLTIITLSSVYVIDLIKGMDSKFSYTILLFIISILGYLWFNATPSKMLMGDAGSRAMGLFISIAVLKMGSPILYLLVAGVLIVDGGLGLIKVSLLRFLKIKILTNVRTPIHDHVRKVWNWSNTHTVYRFAIIQIVLCIAAVYLVIH
ncbi:MAG: phospho-N-acetylmuramoyl-pentapeptide-transferase [Lachnospiraceae bacterium]|nr:phospho-N-acetylmuramoyl-pentapeptide-transferase [Clostridiales bacterium]MDD6293690.1 phospho-N-acetylmuramoyl-pentapeptide-transferase [Eubacteriales bacterium]MDY2607201.1 phospho-N-acetylmuramoyl-pentapeptide-transferase [Lachnospiraceae bacterium]MDY6329608.1 phospho-N-acetylmuramoyl-pentapeptide-transferase [Lachnospiraceae bacterium]